MGLFERFKARRAIKAYARRLPRLLQKDYGGSDAYTPAQVRKTIERHGLDSTHYSYAIAMFSDRDDFDQFHSQFSESVSYDEIRSEIAHHHFGGDVTFSMSDMSSDSFGADGAHHAGDFGGNSDTGSN